MRWRRAWRRRRPRRRRRGQHVAEEDDVESGGPSGIRSFWTGTITFGLVTVPVALYSATRPRGISLRMIAPDGAPVERRYVCSKDEKPLDADDIVRGYEIEKGKFVVVTDEELEAVERSEERRVGKERRGGRQ